MADQLPGRKTDLRPLAPGSDPTHFIRATDYNAVVDHTSGWLNVKSYGVVGDGSTNDAASFVSAVAAAASAGVGVLIPCKARLAGAVGTVSVPVRFEGGGSLDLRSGGSVTLSGELVSGLHQIFYSNGGTLTLRPRVSGYPVEWWGAVGDGSTDDFTAIQAAITAASSTANSAGTVLFRGVTYAHGSTLTITNGVTLRGVSPQARFGTPAWPAVSATKLKFTGNGAGTRVRPAASTAITDVRIVDVELDGSSSGAASTGLYLDAVTNAGAVIAGVMLERVHIGKFTVYQILQDGTVFDVTTRDLTLENYGRTSGGDLYHVGPSGAPTQISFDNPYFIQAAYGQWSFKNEVTGVTVRFNGGGIGPTTHGAHGISVKGGLSLLGTHLEGPGHTLTITNVAGAAVTVTSGDETTISNGDVISQGSTIYATVASKAANVLTMTTPSAGTLVNGSASDLNPNSIGIQYVGSSGATICPSMLIGFGTNLRIGDGTSAYARGWFAQGPIGSYNATGAGDVVITAGGTRAGTLGDIGLVAGVVSVTDSRWATDGVVEVTRIDGATSGYAASTFTPGVTGVTSGQLSIKVGRYQRRGLLVFFTLRVKWAAATPGATLTITGLPYTSSTDIMASANFRTESIVWTSGNLLQAILNNGTSFTMEQVTPAGVISNVALPAAGDIIATGWYFAN